MIRGMPARRASGPLLPLLLLAGVLAAAPAGTPRALAVEGPSQEDPDREFFDRSRAIFETFPRSAVRGSLFTLKFRLHAGYRDPVLVIVFPDGTPLYLRPPFESGDWVGTFRLDSKGGKHRVALVVDSNAGDLTAAQFILSATKSDGSEIDRDVEIPPADTPYDSIPEGEHPLRVERHLFRRMNAFRVKNGLKPLPWHEGVARCARVQIPESAQVFEDSFDPRVGYGFLPHNVPQVVKADAAGNDREVSPEGPRIADRCRTDLGWPVVVPKLPPDNPVRGRGQPNYISESMLAPDPSLDRKFEQTMLRVSDHRAPMLSEWATHAAGAAMWRTFVPRRRVKVVTDSAGRRRLREIPPTTSGSAPEAGEGGSVGARSWRRPGEVEAPFAILVFVQINDPEIDSRDEVEKRRVVGSLARAANPEEEATALRTIGRHAFRESAGILSRRLDDRNPVIAAAAIDGLWLADPDAARRACDRLEVRVVRALARDDFPTAIGALQVLAGLEYDVAGRRSAAKRLADLRRTARSELDIVDRYLVARDWVQARDAFQRVARIYKGLPEAEEAALGLRELLADPEARKVLDAAK